jgi:hypothetical protein
MIRSTVCVMVVVGQVVLPGSKMEPRRAYAEAHTVVVAEAVNVMILGVGAAWFGNVQELKPSAVLKGEAVPKGMMSISGSGDEMPPRSGKEYIFFINDYKGHPRILKVIPKTDENLAAVRPMGD